MTFEIEVPGPRSEKKYEHPTFAHYAVIVGKPKVLGALFAKTKSGTLIPKYDRSVTK
jgi:hypothetical protein